MKESLLSLVENSRNYTLAVADAMPGKLDNFKPAADAWTFREQLHHIAYGIDWWTKNYIDAVKSGWEPPATPGNRKEVVAYLDQAFHSLKETTNNASMNEDRIKGFFATMDHITHHRGQLIVYLRCNGITPPEYTW